MKIRFYVVNRPYTYMDGRTNIYKGVHVLSVHKSTVVLFKYKGRWKKNNEAFWANYGVFAICQILFCNRLPKKRTDRTWTVYKYMSASMSVLLPVRFNTKYSSATSNLLSYVDQA